MTRGRAATKVRAVRNGYSRALKGVVKGYRRVLMGYFRVLGVTRGILKGYLEVLAGVQRCCTGHVWCHDGTSLPGVADSPDVACVITY